MQRGETLVRDAASRGLHQGEAGASDLVGRGAIERSHLGGDDLQHAPSLSELASWNGAP